MNKNTSMHQNHHSYKKNSFKSKIAELWIFINLCFGTGKIFIITLISLVVTAVITLTIPFIFRLFIDQNVQNNFDWSIILLFVTLIIGLAIGTSARYYSITMTGERIYNNLREKAFHHLLTFSEHELSSLHVSDILSRLMSDAEIVRDFTGSSLSIVIRNILLLFGGFTMMLLTGLSMTLMFLLVIPLLVVPILVIGRQLKALSKKTQEKLAHANGSLSESLYALSTIQNFNQEYNQFTKFINSAQSAFVASKKRILKRAFLTFCIIILVFSAILGILLYGSYIVKNGDMTIGIFSQFILYSIFTAGAAAALSEVLGSIYKVKTAYDRINDILLIKPKIQSRANPVLLKDFNNIIFKNISFKYDSRNEYALSDINLEITKGQKVGVVGLSGSGKTTLLKLLLREIRATSGNLLWNNQDIENFCLYKIRQQVSYVSQNITLFTGTIEENIRFANPKATKEQIILAAQQANLHDDIMILPNQYDTSIGERGVQLSGGQRQRIAIARSILKNAPFWILDEPTSALDSETEGKILTTFSHITQDKTVLMVTHRLKILTSADIIYVIEGGKIVEKGTHQKLWNNENSRYRHFLNESNLTISMDK